MGNCFSAHDQKGSKNDQLESLRAEIGVNGYLPKVEADSPLSNQGNPDDMFLDSYAWLESDFEDFVSVGCDFTPSLGTTPIHSSFREPSAGLKSSSTPKQLIELLCESFRSDHEATDEVHIKLDIKEKVEAKLIAFFISPDDINNPVPRNKDEPLEPSYICPRENTITTISCPKNTKEKTPISKECSSCLPCLVQLKLYHKREEANPCTW